jgi:hypothetical protein
MPFDGPPPWNEPVPNPPQTAMPLAAQLLLIGLGVLFLVCAAVGWRVTQ